MSSASKIVLPVEEIENLWFGGLDLGPGKPVAMDCAKRWFMGGEEFDTTCKKYQPVIEQVAKLSADEIIALADTPQKSLTLLLILDQLPRNSYRGNDFPFTTCDPLARALAEHSIFKSGHDKQHPPYKRMWYYMPFEHSENIHYQELGLWKFSELCWELREGEWKETHGFIKLALGHAWQHFEAIDKFGRFPLRNKAMGRETTEEEEKYIVEKGGRAGAQ